MGGRNDSQTGHFIRWGQGNSGSDLEGKAVFEVYSVYKNQPAAKRAILAVPLNDGMLQGGNWKTGNIPLAANLLHNPRMAYDTYKDYQYRQASLTLRKIARWLRRLA